MFIKIINGINKTNESNQNSPIVTHKQRNDKNEKKVITNIVITRQMEKEKKMSEAKRTEYYHFIYFADTNAMREKVERDRKGEHGENL